MPNVENLCGYCGEEHEITTLAVGNVKFKSCPAVDPIKFAREYLDALGKEWFDRECQAQFST